MQGEVLAQINSMISISIAERDRNCDTKLQNDYDSSKPVLLQNITLAKSKFYSTTSEAVDFRVKLDYECRWSTSTNTHAHTKGHLNIDS